MKKSKIILMCFLLFFCLGAGKKEETGNSDFVIENGVLTEYKGEAEEVVIPDGVTEIAKDAFCSRDGLKKVVLPESVEKIGIAAFVDCMNLQEINLEHVKYIGEGAFEWCNNLEKVDLTSAVVIQAMAFEQCEKLTKVALPEVEVLGDNAFSSSGLTDVTGLEKVTSVGRDPFLLTPYREHYFSDASTQYHIINGYLTYAGNLTEVMEIPDGVQVICGSAFSYGSMDAHNIIREIILPDSVRIIESGAFAYQRQLEKINLGQVEEIGREAFQNCKKLQNVDLTSAVEIRQEAFEYCSELKCADMPLVKILESGAFIYSGLTQVSGLDKVEEVGADPFFGTPYREQYFADKTTQFHILNGYLISAGNCAKTVTIPKGVTVICGNAFYNRPVTNLYIPEGVTTIQAGALYGNSLRYVRMADSVTVLEGGQFTRKLIDVRLSQNITKLEDDLLGDTHLKQLTIPKAVIEISDWSLWNARLQHITIPSTMTEQVCKELIEATKQMYTVPTIYADTATLAPEVKKLLEENYTLKKLALQKKKLTLEVGATYKLRMNGYSKCDTWKSSNPKIASVSRTGKITAKKKGTVTITASLYGKEYKCTVKVN